MRKLSLPILALLMTAVSFGQWDMYNPNPNNDPANAAEQLLNPTNHDTRDVI